MIQLVYMVTMFVNAVLATEGILPHYLPREIMTQRKIDFVKDCKVKFGQYIKASEDDMVTNTMNTWTHPYIAMGPSRNWQGSTKCFDLCTGNIVTWRTVTAPPMPELIQKLVNTWGLQAQGKKCKNSVEFLNCMKHKFEWENNDIPMYKTTGEEKNIIHPTLNTEIPGVVLEEDFEDVAEAIIKTPGPTD